MESIPTEKPAVEAQSEEPIAIRPILADAWQIYRQQFKVIAAVAAAVWLPCDLLSSYFDAFVFGPDNFRASFKLTQFLDNFIGIIATAGVIFIALSSRSGQAVTFRNAMAAGFSSWGRMWWSRLLSGFVLLVTTVFFILPGLYFATRFCFIEVLVVAECISGKKAMVRSLELTRDRFGQAFLLCLTIALLWIVPYILILCISVMGNWLTEAAGQFATDLLFAFTIVAFFCAYERYAKACKPSAELK